MEVQVIDVLGCIGFLVYVYVLGLLITATMEYNPSKPSTPDDGRKLPPQPDNLRSTESEAAEPQHSIEAAMEYDLSKSIYPNEAANNQELPESPGAIAGHVNDLQPINGNQDRPKGWRLRLSGKMIILLWIVMIGGPALGFFIDQNNRVNEIPETIQALGTANHEAALSRLVEIGGQAVKPLIGSLNNENPLIRARVVEALTLIKDERTIEPLIPVLQDKYPTIRAAAVNALSQFEDKCTVMPLIALLKDEDVRVRVAAVDALSKTGDERIVEPLIALLKDEDVRVRLAAVEALSKTTDERIIEPLIALLDDSFPTVRVKAAEVLVIMKDERAVEPLMKAIEKKDLPVIASISSFFIKRGRAGDEPIFIDALNINGTRSTAENYLNSGNVELTKAAEIWAKANGYTITQARPGQSFPQWGGD